MSATDSASKSSLGDSSVLSDHGPPDLDQDKLEGEDGADFEERSRIVQHAVFATVNVICKSSGRTSWRWIMVITVVEFLQLLRIVLDPSLQWTIKTNSSIWKVIYWVNFKDLVLPKGHVVYASVLYALVGILPSVLAFAALMGFLQKKGAIKAWYLHSLLAVVQFLGFIVFQLMWVAIMDFIIFMYDCDWRKMLRGVPHQVFEDTGCFTSPHVAPAFIGVVLLAIYVPIILTACMGACELNILTRKPMAQSLPGTAITIAALKMVLIVLARTQSTYDRAQSVLMPMVTLVIFLLHLLRQPYYNQWFNHLWTGLYSSIFGMTILYAALVLSPLKSTQHRETLTMALVYVMIPLFFVGAGISWLVYRRLSKKALQQLKAAFQEPFYKEHPRDAFKFRSMEKVLLLARVARTWDLDGEPVPETAALGDFILKVGMARLPGCAYLRIVYSAYRLEAFRDTQAARTQLLLAAKDKHSRAEQYFICTYQETLSRYKGDSDSLDLLGYVEFQRCYRTCVRWHKAALATQRKFWMCLLRSTVQLGELQKAITTMKVAEQKASTVYKRALERYQSSGRLLKAYGRFEEYVVNDPWTANKYYQMAVKEGLTESMIALAGNTEALELALGQVDEKQDGVMIINAEGTILMTNPAANHMFGYLPGELDQRNVSVLMPQPFSGRHNSYLQRYTNSMQPHILDTARMVVAVNSKRVVFPMTLCVVKLMGAGQECIFMGVMRAAITDDPKAVKVWCTPTGTVLCAAEGYRDAFGSTGLEVAGKELSSLSPDQEALEGFLKACSKMTDDDIAAGREGPRLETKMLHKYLAPVKVELTVEFGGTAEARIYIVNIQSLAEEQALMVVDQKGKFVHCTKMLASLLGYKARDMLNMELMNLIPPPVSHLHTGWLKDLPAGKPPPTSCRAGAVVNLLASNGNKVPVTLELNQVDDGENLVTVVEVTKSSEAEAQDQQRLQLFLDAEGRIIDINPNASAALFGFDPHELRGRFLSASVDVFEDYKLQFGNEIKLLALLAARCRDHAGESWRVSVHGVAHSRSSVVFSGEGSLLQMSMLKQHERPAIMRILARPNKEDEEEEGATAQGQAGALGAEYVLEVQLWKPEALHAMLELDSWLVVTAADLGAQLIWGHELKALLKQHLKSLADVPPGWRDGEYLLGGGGGKKGLMKSGAAWRVGPVLSLEAIHLDGDPVKLSLQAVSKDGQSSHILLVQMSILEPASPGLEALLAKVAADGSGPARQLEAGPPTEAEADEGADSFGSGEGGVEDAEEDAEVGEHKRRGSGEIDLRSRARVANWVRDSFRANTAPPPEDDEEGLPTQKVGHKGRLGGPNRAEADRDGHPKRKGRDLEGAAYPPSDEGGRRQKCGLAKWGGARGSAQLREAEEEQESHAVAHVSRGGPVAAVGQKGGGHSAPRGLALDAADKEDDHSRSSSASGSEANMDASSAAGSGDGEELTSDWRRAKRLKKLKRLLQSRLAQKATERFRVHTWYVLLVMLVAHVVCFIVLAQQVTGRYQDFINVQRMATGLKYAEMSVIRANYLQKCKLPDFVHMALCSADNLQSFRTKLDANNKFFRNTHKALYLGDSSTQGFRDARLYEYWTHKPQREAHWYVAEENVPGQVYTESSSLWTMGNRYAAATDEVLFYAEEKGAGLFNTSAWQYVLRNGPDIISGGYKWSMDVIVDYTWGQLEALTEELVVLLVLEFLVALLASIVYEYVQLWLASNQHLKRFSVFLSLPSTTIRTMASRVLKVDDDDGDDDIAADDEVANLTAALEKEQQLQQQSKDGALKPAKEVRINTGGGGSDEQEDRGKKGRGKKGRGKRVADEEAGSDDVEQQYGRTKNKDRKNADDDELLLQPPAGVPAPKQQTNAWKKALKQILGLSGIAMKLNGKKITPNVMAILLFMAPLLLWATLVIIIFGVSFDKLGALNTPLTSLLGAARVVAGVPHLRLAMNELAFAETVDEYNLHRQEVMDKLAILEADYNTLIFGGELKTFAPVNFNTQASSAAFADAAVAFIFFGTRDCLRHDRSTCFGPDHPYYDISHRGLHAMMTQFFKSVRVFAGLPMEEARPDHSSYTYITDVMAYDAADGLDTASDLFVEHAIAQLQVVKSLHTVLLILTFSILLGFVMFLFRPYVAAYEAETKSIAGMLSHLPAEVNVESQIKTLVMGITRPEGELSMGGGSRGPSGFGMAMPGMVPGMLPGMMPPYGAGVMMQGGYGAMGAGPMQGGWGQQQQRMGY